MSQMDVKFDVSHSDLELISKIADRWKKLEHHQHKRNRTHLMMDLCAVQNSCPMDLAGLLHADDFDFVHDIIGIERHLNRETGQLQDCFLPRASRN